MDKNATIVTNLDGKKFVLINDLRFRAKKREDWKVVEEYLKEYIGEFYEVEETSEKIYISSDFPDEYANSESRMALKGAVAKAKANASQGIPEMIKIANNAVFEVNVKKKHERDAKFGWYKYHTRFALPVYSDVTGDVVRYNMYTAKMIVRYAEDGKKYLYDIISIKKETSSPLES